MNQQQQPIDITAIQKQLRPFDFNNPTISELERQYLNHYNINFSEKLNNVTHYFGTIDTLNFHIATHYFEVNGSKGTLFILHGYFDHAGLYQHIINHYLTAGFSIIVYDLPGHGLSTGSAASIDDFSHYVDVLRCCLTFFSQQSKTSPIKPWFAIAQSTGAAILMDFLLSKRFTKDNCPFKQTILLAPLVRPVRWSSVRLSYYLFRFFINGVKRKFNSNSHDKNFLNFLYHQDPLQATIVPVRWVGSLIRWNKIFHQYPKSSLSPIIIQGKEDSTVDWQYNLPLIKTKFQHANIHYLHNGKHQLANEDKKIRQSMLAIIDTYLNHNKNDQSS